MSETSLKENMDLSNQLQFFVTFYKMSLGDSFYVIVFRPYEPQRLIYPVKCISDHLVKREEIITYGKSYQVASKDALAQWVKDVMKESDISPGIYKSHGTRTASNAILCISRRRSKKEPLV